MQLQCLDTSPGRHHTSYEIISWATIYRWSNGHSNQPFRDQKQARGQQEPAHRTGYLVFLIRSPSRCETEKRLAHLDLWDARITNFILFNYLKNSPGHFCLIMTRSPGMLVVSCFEIYYQSAWGRVHCSVLLIIFQSTERRRPSASVRIILNLLLRLDLYFIL